MSYRDDLLELLSSSEHIATTLEIGDTIWDVKARLQVRFWEEIERRLREGVQDLGFGRAWTVESRGDVLRNPGGIESGFHVVARQEDAGPRLLVGAWQEAQRVFYGVGFDKKQAHPHPLQVIRDLAGSIAQDSREKISEWYLGWEWTDIRLDRKDVLIMLASDASGVVDQAVAPVLEILRRHGTAIAAADRALLA